ncbi:hypothetical protein KA005_77540 [bacterium]|nr:hypothetical protein [bacterium]
MISVLIVLALKMLDVEGNSQQAITAYILRQRIQRQPTMTISDVSFVKIANTKRQKRKT